MAVDPEAQAQLARLLADESLRAASESELRRAVDQRFDWLVDGVAQEAAASDDVFDKTSAFDFVAARVDNFGGALSTEQKSRLLAAVRGKIEAW